MTTSFFSSFLRKNCRPITHALSLLPLIALLGNLASNNLGTNPVEAITHSTGEWSLRLLLLTLAVSPLAKWTKSAWLMPCRRPLGLYSAFYALLHFLIYAILDQSLNLYYIVEDILERPFITAGFIAFVLLLPLVFTSTLKARRRMGRRWVKLHRLTYLVGGAAVVHLIWLTKADYLEPLVYLCVFTALMAARLKLKK